MDYETYAKLQLQHETIAQLRTQLVALNTRYTELQFAIRRHKIASLNTIPRPQDRTLWDHLDPRLNDQP